MLSFRIPMVQVLRYRSYTLIVTGHVLSAIGARLLTVCLMVFVYETTGSALNVATMSMMFMIAMFVARPLGGIVTDRVDRKLLLATAFLVEGMVALAAWFNPQMWLIYGANFIMGACTAIRSPAFHAVIPEMVPSGELYAANAMWVLGRRVSHITGPVLAAAVISAYGAASGFAVHAVAAGLSAAVVMGAVVPRSSRSGDGSGIAADIGAQWAFLRARPQMIMCSIALGVHGFIVGMNNVLVVPFVFEHMRLDGSELSLMVSALAAGLFVGSFAIGNFGQSLSPAFLMWGCLVAMGVTFIGFGLTRALLIALVLRVLIGAIDAGFSLGATTLLQVNTPPALRGKVSGTLRAGEDGLLLAGLSAGGIAAMMMPVPTVFIIAGLVSIVFAATAWLAVGRPDADSGT